MSEATVRVLVEAAGAAASPVRETPRAVRAGWLRAMAAALDGEVGTLVDIADRETRLGRTRLSGEVARTTGQLRLFAEVLDEGSYLEAMVDVASPDAVPPRPELRRVLRPLGPVAVFSASNFPFAFSVAGGDTAAALAAGCPVVVKAHSGHPELSRRVAQIVAAALRGVGAPDGVFAVVEGRAAGIELVGAPQIAAAAFTGSLAGARALMTAIAERPDPIPFYGELGGTNPVVVSPGAYRERAEDVIAGLVASFTLGAGQFCTKPGIVFAPRGLAESAALRERVAAIPHAALLTSRIQDAFDPTLALLQTEGGARLVAGRAPSAGPLVAPAVLAVDIDSFTRHVDVLREECFGPATLLVEYDEREELLAALRRLPGSLTATVHATADEDVSDVVEILSEIAGRVLFGGWPTGVAVTWSQHHGGPWPATTSTFTSVGATSIRRFLRPIVYQDAPARLLPDDLRDEGLQSIPHRRDGVLRLPALVTGGA